MRPALVPVLRCRLCRILLTGENPKDDLERGICGDCRNHPDAQKLAPTAPKGTSRPFNAAEKSLIARVHGYMAPHQLLDVLNTRLEADDPDAIAHTMEQLQAEIRAAAADAAEKNGGRDWASLRKLLAGAQRSGLLAKINSQLVDDFAVVFQLTPAQVLRAKDVVLGAIADVGEES